MVCPICLTSAVLANAPILAAGIAATTAAQQGRKMVMHKKREGEVGKYKVQEPKTLKKQGIKKGEFKLSNYK